MMFECLGADVVERCRAPCLRFHHEGRTAPAAIVQVGANSFCAPLAGVHSMVTITTAFV